jgi:hypothetical protein
MDEIAHIYPVNRFKAFRAILSNPVILGARVGVNIGILSQNKLSYSQILSQIG